MDPLPLSRLVRHVWAVGAPLLSGLLQAQSFTHTMGAMNAQDGIGAWPTTEGYRVAIREYVGSPHAYTGTLHHAGPNGVITALGIPLSEENTFLQNVVAHSDGGACLVGSVLRTAPHVHDALAVRTSITGEILWSHAPALSGAQQFFGGVGLDDGGVVLCGVSDQGDGHRPLVMRFGADGEVLWSYIGTEATEAEAYDVAVEADVLMVTGRVANFSGQDDILACRLSLDGDLVWTSAFGGAGSDMGRAVIARGNGSFLIAGSTNSYGTFDQSSQRTPFHGYVLGLDLAGDTLFTRALGDTLSDIHLYAMAGLANGDVYLAGERGTSALSDALLLRIAANGTVVWQRVLDLGKEERITHVHALSDGVLATGWAFSEFGRQVLFIRRDTNGN